MGNFLAGGIGECKKSSEQSSGDLIITITIADGSLLPLRDIDIYNINPYEADVHVYLSPMVCSGHSGKLP